MPLGEAESWGEGLTRERLENTPMSDGSAAVPRKRRARGFSLLRASAGERLGLVAAALVLLWLSVYWALQ